MYECFSTSVSEVYVLTIRGLETAKKYWMSETVYKEKKVTTKSIDDINYLYKILSMYLIAAAPMPFSYYFSQRYDIGKLI